MCICAFKAKKIYLGGFWPIHICCVQQQNFRFLHCRPIRTKLPSPHYLTDVSAAICLLGKYASPQVDVIVKKPQQRQTKQRKHPPRYLHNRSTLHLRRPPSYFLLCLCGGRGEGRRTRIPFTSPGHSGLRKDMYPLPAGGGRCTASHYDSSPWLWLRFPFF